MICTKNGCEQAGAVLKDMAGHIRLHHIALLPSEAKILNKLLGQLNLDSPAPTYLIPSFCQLPRFLAWRFASTAGIAAHAAIYDIESDCSFYGHVKQNNERE